jgi:hypothetical protein
MTTETTQIARQSPNGIQVFDLTQGLPDLDESETLPFDLMADYWTPTAIGESKKMFFDKIGIRKVLDQKTGELIELECAFFLEQVKDGKGNVEVKSVSNGAKKLVSAIEGNDIHRGTPLLVTYLGKKKNVSNSQMSDQWSIKPLILNV